jgi:hypothetical protein
VEVRRQYGLTGRSRNGIVQQKGQYDIYKLNASGCSTQAKKNTGVAQVRLLGQTTLLHCNILLDFTPKMEIIVNLTGKFYFFAMHNKANFFKNEEENRWNP